MKRRNLAILFMIAILVALAFAVIPGQKGKRPTVAQINATIKAKGAGWVAKENKFSHWTTEELKSILGVLPLEEASTESKASGKPSGKPEKKPPKPQLPKSFDWRDYNGNWVTPVKDQSPGDTRCGSCWAFATVAQMESLILIKNNTPYPNLDVDLSEQFIVSCDTSNSGCNGGNMERVYNFVRDTGTPDEFCFIYWAEDVPCDLRCGNWADLVKKIDRWSWVSRRGIDNNKIKKAVYENGPLTCAFNVYEDFFQYASGCYEHTTGDRVGGHAVCIVGWTAENCWIVKNSWGSDWGDEGFFKIKFDNCRFGRSAGKFIYKGS